MELGDAAHELWNNFMTLAAPSRADAMSTGGVFQPDGRPRLVVQDDPLEWTVLNQRFHSGLVERQDLP